MILVLLGQIPSGKNQIKLCVRGGKIHKYPDARFILWREDVLNQIVVQRGTTPTRAVPLTLRVEYTPSDRRVRDASGMLDAIFHVLAKAGTIDDDGLIWDIQWIRRPIDKLQARVVLTLSEWKERQ
jgi:Holliday junction resolvase RusA-like endonuclease